MLYVDAVVSFSVTVIATIIVMDCNFKQKRTCTLENSNGGLIFELFFFYFNIEMAC